MYFNQIRIRTVCPSVETFLPAVCCKCGVISFSVLRGEYLNVKVLRRTDGDQVMTNAHIFFINLVFSEVCLIVTSYKMSDML